MKILVIVAHPDDEILGCGGTIARLIKEGNEVYTLILGEGITSRDDKRDVKKRNNEITKLKNMAKEAGRMLGVKQVLCEDFPDNRFDTVPFLDIVKVIESVKCRLKPEVVFTHYNKDLNIDHQITYKAVITGTRPMKGESVKQIYSFEISSSTEWNFPSTFSPDTFFDISTTLKDKLKAMSIYATELKDSPHLRSLKGIEINASFRGMGVGLQYAEAFKTIRMIK